jgi:hypothetical protein
VSYDLLLAETDPELVWFEVDLSGGDGSTFKPFCGGVTRRGCATSSLSTIIPGSRWNRFVKATGMPGAYPKPRRC